MRQFYFWHTFWCIGPRSCKAMVMSIETLEWKFGKEIVDDLKMQADQLDFKMYIFTQKTLCFLHFPLQQRLIVVRFCIAVNCSANLKDDFPPLFGPQSAAAASSFRI